MLKSLNPKISEAARHDELIWIIPEFWTACSAILRIFLWSLLFSLANAFHHPLEGGKNISGRLPFPNSQQVRHSP